MSKRQERVVKRRNLSHLPWNPEEDPIARGCGITPVAFDRAIPVDALCHYCGKIGADTRDHIVPKMKLGTDAWWNLVPSCEPCNRRKSEKDTDCKCAYCVRAVFLFELGHKRQPASPRSYYIDPETERKRENSLMRRVCP